MAHTTKTKQHKQKRVVIVPGYDSHARPMYDLASLLHAEGFSITVAHTKFNFPNPADHPPEYTFVKLEDNSDGIGGSIERRIALLRVVNESCMGPFEELMAQLTASDDGGGGEKEEIACVVYDPLMKFAEVAAKKVRMVAFWTVPAIYVRAYIVLNRLIEDGAFPVKGPRADEEVPEALPLRIRDIFPVVDMEIPQLIKDFLRGYMDLAPASAMVWNTIDFLDGPALEELHAQRWRVPSFPLMPLHKLAAATDITKTTSDDGDACLSWLDKKGPKSVIYVALGIVPMLDGDSLGEFARGLARSQQPFLWSLRHCSVSELPPGFLEEVGDRGLVVEWADQKRVLAHGSVGGFLTHCGWNSVVEGLAEGVPLLCRPCVGDQCIDARYVTSVWRLGIELERGDGGVERSVRALMVGEECREIRERVMETKAKIEEGVRASRDCLGRLVDFINK